MKKKILCLGILISILLSQFIPINGVNFVLYDDTQDIIHFSEGITITLSTSAYDEIDIEEFVIDGLVINIIFVDEPVWDANYFYSCDVRWNGDDDGSNYTKALWSNGYDEVRTRLLDNTGALIVNNYQEGIIDPVGNSLIIPILNVSLISNVFSPSYITIEANITIVGTPEFYEDRLLYDSNKGLSGFNYLITIISLTSIVITYYFIIRMNIKKK